VGESGKYGPSLGSRFKPALGGQWNVGMVSIKLYPGWKQITAIPLVNILICIAFHKSSELLALYIPFSISK